MNTRALPGERPSAAFARCGEYDIFYDTFGVPAARPLLLIMGLGAQMILWPEVLCQALADAGYFVIRFDNRDAGRSSRGPRLTRSALPVAMVRTLFGARARAPYTLEDMAADAVGLLDHLGVARAHVWGVSMGGMIAQTLAIHHSERMASMVSMMSSAGKVWAAPARPRVLRALISRRRVASAEAYAERMVAFFRVIGSPGYPFPAVQIRQRFLRAYARGASVDGTRRQLLAILASGDRSADLARVRVPTLVIHGRADPLIPMRGGQATAEALTAAEVELMLIEGMGHDLPPALLPRFVEAVCRHTARAEAAGSAGAWRRQSRSGQSRSGQS